jgi:hypothetical protein
MNTVAAATYAAQSGRGGDHLEELQRMMEILAVSDAALK